MRSAVPLLSIALAGCGGSGVRSMTDLRSTDITFPNGKKIVAETMRDRVDLVRGMMFRDALPEDRGMLFVHPKPALYTYWTYQVKIPLDILWLDRDRRIVEISANTPPCTSTSSKECPNYGGHEVSQYVLELGGGVAARNRLRVGDGLGF